MHPSPVEPSNETRTQATHLFYSLVRACGAEDPAKPNPDSTTYNLHLARDTYNFKHLYTVFFFVRKVKIPFYLFSL